MFPQIHADHRPHRHVHALAFLNKKLTRAEINFLREAATRLSLVQRRILDLTAERAPAAQHKLRIKPEIAKKPAGRGVIQAKGSAGLAAPGGKQATACPRGCGGYAQTMTRLSSKIQRCESCGIVVRTVGLEQQIEGPGLYLGHGL